MVILGVDPGSRFCGYGLLEVENRKIIAAGCDVIKIDPKLDLNQKLLIIHNELRDVINRYNPDLAAVESIFYGKNIQTAFTLGHVRGAILLTLSQADIETEGYTPREIKKAVVGNGNASKKQVRYMVEQILNLSKKPNSDDAADGLAIALCHYNKNRFRY